MATPEKVDSKDLSVHELALANQKIRKLEQKEKGYKGQIAMLQGKHPTPSQEASPETPETSQKNGEASQQPHFVGSWQKNCPHCSQPNPAWKDETVCDPDKGGCGSHLGAAKDAKEFESCPNCGAKELLQIAGDRA